MRNVAPVTLTLPPELLARVDHIAAAADRSRSAMAARLLQAACDIVEIPPSDMAAAGADTAAGTGAPSPAPAAPKPGGLLKVAPPQPAAQCGAGAGRFPASVPYAALHIDALRRQGDAKRAQDAALAEVREQAMQETEQALKGIEI